MPKSKKANRRLHPWIVTAGTTRHLVEARTKEEALTAFLDYAPVRSQMRIDEPEIFVREAASDEVAAFSDEKVTPTPSPSPPTLPFDGVLTVALPAVSEAQVQQPEPCPERHPEGEANPFETGADLQALVDAILAEFIRPDRPDVCRV